MRRAADDADAFEARDGRREANQSTGAPLFFNCAARYA
jgi:hypothetical protein